MSLINERNRFFISVGGFDCDWSTIYADGPIEFIKDKLTKDLGLMEYFFSEFETFKPSIQENMIKFLDHGDHGGIALNYIPRLKELLNLPLEVGVKDAILGLFEELNITHDLKLGFLKDYDLKPKWLDEYAKSIAENN